jgi:hypothetical protein
MPHALVIHLTNEDPVVGEVDEMPKPADTIITVNNPRRRDGKDLHYLDSNVVQVIFPLARVSFIEVLPSEAEEKIIGFVRE